MSLAAMETLAKSDNTCISASSSPHNKKAKNGNWKLISYKLQGNGNFYLKERIVLLTHYICI